MAFVPMHFWPWFAEKRRRLRAHGWRGPVVDPEAVKTVTALLQERHIVTTKDFAGGTGTGWLGIGARRFVGQHPITARGAAFAI